MPNFESEDHIIVMVPKDLVFADKTVNFSISVESKSQVDVRFDDARESRREYYHHSVPTPSDKHWKRPRSFSRSYAPGNTNPYDTPEATGLSRRVERVTRPIETYEQDDWMHRGDRAPYKHQDARLPEPRAQEPVLTADPPLPALIQEAGIRESPATLINTTNTPATEKQPPEGGLRKFDFTSAEMEQICAAIKEGQSYSQAHEKFSHVMRSTFKTRYYRIKSDMDRLNMK